MHSFHSFANILESRGFFSSFEQNMLMLRLQLHAGVTLAIFKAKLGRSGEHPNNKPKLPVNKVSIALCGPKAAPGLLQFKPFAHIPSVTESSPPSPCVLDEQRDPGGGPKPQITGERILPMQLATLQLHGNDAVFCYTGCRSFDTLAHVCCSLLSQVFRVFGYLPWNCTGHH